jgi:hypothetical protein
VDTSDRLTPFLALLMTGGVLAYLLRSSGTCASSPGASLALARWPRSFSRPSGGPSVAPPAVAALGLIALVLAVLWAVVLRENRASA